MKKQKKSHAKLQRKQRHPQYVCFEFVRFITILSVVGILVIGGNYYFHNKQESEVLGAQTSMAQPQQLQSSQCSRWNILCFFKNIFNANNTSSSLPMQQGQQTGFGQGGTQQMSGTTMPMPNIVWNLDTTQIPLGDYKLSTTSPQVGYIYSCTTPSGSRGAQTNGSWINKTTWNLTEKTNVQGNISWPNATFSIVTSGTNRVITGNGLPVGVTTGIFPIASTDPAYKIDKNPNSIKAQTVSLTLPLNPTMGASPTCVGMGKIGVSIDGVAIYNGVDEQGRDAVAHEEQDSCGGHPDVSGEYHYHGPSSCVTGTKQNNTLVGYALDGYGIYSMYDANGKEYTNADLDECHGITSEIMWNGKMVTMYHYVETQEYPYTIGCYRGSVVAKTGMGQGINQRLGGGQGGQQGGVQGQFPMMGGQQAEQGGFGQGGQQGQYGIPQSGGMPPPQNINSGY
ncbi:MAG TPA: YHYH protein [Patescibacteria group bacterium]